MDLSPKACAFDPHRRHCLVSLSKKINPCFVPVQHRKTRPDITEIADLDVNNQIK